jgi:hypothetical protein
MKRSVALTAMACSCFVLFACASQKPPSGLVVSNVTVVSPERAGLLKNAHVRILDGRIAELSDQPLRGEAEIDGPGKFLIQFTS